MVDSKGEWYPDIQILGVDESTVDLVNFVLKILLFVL